MVETELTLKAAKDSPQWRNYYARLSDLPKHFLDIDIWSPKHIFDIDVIGGLFPQWRNYYAHLSDLPKHFLDTYIIVALFPPVT